MGKIGCGYGSEFHLLRYLGYHRQKLSRAVEKETGGRVLDWLDLGVAGNENRHYLDLEFRGLDFLGADHPARAAWKDFWPQTGNVQNWDAVGVLESGYQVEYLLVEAKGHVEEIRSNCNAEEHGGRPKIRGAFDEAIMAWRSEKTVDNWLNPYYQYANRLTTLHFLVKHGLPARLIFIYFVGDRWPQAKTLNGQPVFCPKSRQEWESPVEKMYDHLGLKGLSDLEQRVHRLFLPVGGPE